MQSLAQRYVTGCRPRRKPCLWEKKRGKRGAGIIFVRLFQRLLEKAYMEGFTKREPRQSGITSFAT